MFELLLVFLWGGLIGWIIDSSYCSIIERRFTSGVVIPGFATTYGCGALLLYIYYQITNAPFFLHVLGAGLLLTGLELVSGIIGAKLLKRRVWDYSENRFNYKGHIDLLHSTYWTILAGIMKCIYPFIPFIR